MLPALDLSDERLPGRDSVDRHNLAKQGAKALRIPAFGLPATPTEPVALNRDEATLNADRRPLAAQQAEQVRGAVNRGTERS